MGTTSSVVLLESGASASTAPIPPRPPPPRRGFRRRTGAVIGVALGHAAFIWGIAEYPDELLRPVETVAVVAVLIRPRVIVSREPIAPRLPIYVPMEAPILSDLETPEVSRPTVAVLGVGTMPPHADDASVDPTLFARQAGLKPGEGATVVLRVEVLGTGKMGRVEIEVSGGSANIDRAALDYAETVAWYGGTVDGRPVTMWIRWGVRLQA